MGKVNAFAYNNCCYSNQEPRQIPDNFIISSSEFWRQNFLFGRGSMSPCRFLAVRAHPEYRIRGHQYALSFVYGAMHVPQSLNGCLLSSYSRMRPYATFSAYKAEQLGTQSAKQTLKYRPVRSTRVKQEYRHLPIDRCSLDLAYSTYFCRPAAYFRVQTGQ